MRELYSRYPYDGKFILDGGKLVICQSNVPTAELRLLPGCCNQPNWRLTGGTDVDTEQQTESGSDMADSVTGGGLHGKDLSKADVSINIYCFLKAQETGGPVEISCAIGDTVIDGKPYSEIVKIAGNHIRSIGGFEHFAEWGLV